MKRVEIMKNKVDEELNKAATEECDKHYGGDKVEPFCDGYILGAKFQEERSSKLINFVKDALNEAATNLDYETWLRMWAKSILKEFEANDDSNG